MGDEEAGRAAQVSVVRDLPPSPGRSEVWTPGNSLCSVEWNLVVDFRVAGSCSNDIPVGERGANIDHLVVDVGIFTVNMKNLSGKVWVAPRTLLVNGRKAD